MYTSNTFCTSQYSADAQPIFCKHYHIVPIQYSAKDRSLLVCAISALLCFCTHEYTSDCFAPFSNSALFLLFVVTFQPSLSPVSLFPDNYMNSK